MRRTDVSTVFAASHAAATPTADKCITFTDTSLETAAVLRLFFTFATTFRFDMTLRPGEMVLLLRFLRKWDCVNLEDLAIDRISVALQLNRFYPSQVMHLGAELDDAKLRRLAFHQDPIRVAPATCFKESSLAVHRWEPAQWSRFSMTYMYALSKVPPPTREPVAALRALSFEKYLLEAKSGFAKG